jgi:sentrin-specific protease 2 (axin associating molecule)
MPGRNRMVFREPGKAQKKTPQEPQDLELPREQPNKCQVQKPRERLKNN